jgi:hypothetical protein
MNTEIPETKARASMMKEFSKLKSFRKSTEAMGKPEQH